MAGQQLQRFAHLHGGNHRDDRHDDAGRVARRRAARRGRFFKHAAQARADVRSDRHRHAVRADCRAVDPVDVVLHAGFVDEVARREVVRAVEHEIAVCDETLDVALMHVQHFRLNNHVRVDLRDVPRARDGFRQTLTRVVFGEHRLPLQVRLFDEIPVRDPQTADTRASQRLDLRRPQRATADDEHARRTQTRLPFRADALE